MECADPSQPGVASVDRSGAYYLVNSYNPGYLGAGQPAALGPTQFTIPPTRQDNIGLLLSRHHVSWKYYGQGWDGGRERPDPGAYCNICDPFLYSEQIMTNPALRRNSVGPEDLYADICRGSLLDVGIVKPDDLLDGHSASSRVDLLEGFVHRIVMLVQAKPHLWRDTAIMITVDEGGDFYDEGYVQPIDFFGDGTRIPFIVISRYSRGGRIVHTYDDHLSFDKFVEANWRIHERISSRGRDNLPNLRASRSDPYGPRYAPAIGDLMDMFEFRPRQRGCGRIPLCRRVRACQSWNRPLRAARSVSSRHRQDCPDEGGRGALDDLCEQVEVGAGVGRDERPDEQRPNDDCHAVGREPGERHCQNVRQQAHGYAPAVKRRQRDQIEDCENDIELDGVD